MLEILTSVFTFPNTKSMAQTDQTIVQTTEPAHRHPFPAHGYSQSNRTDRAASQDAASDEDHTIDLRNIA
jgi:hypothetical protein